MVLGQVARPLAGGCYLKAAASGPVHVLTDQCRLIAPGKTVDHTRCAGLLRQQRPCKNVCFDIDHHDMVTRADRRLTVVDPGVRNTGRFHDNVNPPVFDQGKCIFSKVGTPTGDRRVNGSGIAL